MVVTVNYLKPSKYNNNNKNCFYTAAGVKTTAAAAGVQCGCSGWTERERNKKMLKVYKSAAYEAAKTFV